MFGLFSTLPSTTAFESQRQTVENSYNLFHTIKNSDEFKRYEALKVYVQSAQYKTELNTIRTLSYKTSKEYSDEQRWKELRNSKEVKNFRKTGVDNDSVYVTEYIQLDEKINSPTYLQHKAYLKNKKRHLQSDPYLKWEEYRRLEKSQNIRQYYQLQKKYAALFAKMEQCKVLFYDEFNTGKLSETWSHKPYWTSLLFAKNYSPNTEEQLFNEGKNSQLTDNVVQLITKHESASGVAWDQHFGFVPREFSYTSDMLSTAHQFEMQYGSLEAKISFSNVKNIYGAFWLGSKMQTPAITVAHYCNQQLMMGAYETGKVSSLSKKIKLRDASFYIFRLDRSPKTLTWYINGKKMYECANPTSEALYITFASGVIAHANEQQLPTAFEIDYVKLIALEN